MLDVVRELVDAVASLRGISGNQQADLHARLDKAAADLARESAAGSAKPAKANVPAGA